MARLPISARVPISSRSRSDMRDPVTLAIVVTDAPELHGRLLATLHAVLPRVGVLDPCAFACDLAGTEELLGAPARVGGDRADAIRRARRRGANAAGRGALGRRRPRVPRVSATRCAPGRREGA